MNNESNNILLLNSETEKALKDIATFNDFQSLELEKLNTNLELQRQQLKRIANILINLNLLIESTITVNVNNTSLKNINKKLEKINENLKQ